jgi:hypothetical protein
MFVWDQVRGSSRVLGEGASRRGARGLRVGRLLAPRPRRARAARRQQPGHYQGARTCLGALRHLPVLRLATTASPCATTRSYGPRVLQKVTVIVSLVLWPCLDRACATTIHSATFVLPIRGQCYEL